MNTYRQAELLADQIIGAFQRDMQRAPNVCACCKGAATWPNVGMGVTQVGAGELVSFPLCKRCADKAQRSARHRRAVMLRCRAYVARGLATGGTP
jgi:hypothetical protein